MAAKTGEASEVPPMRYSLYWIEPSGKVWLCPTRKPVCGSPTAETSGTTRCLVVPLLVSQLYVLLLPTASEVPPTAVTHGELAGASTCFTPVLASSSPLSPE